MIPREVRNASHLEISDLDEVLIVASRNSVMIYTHSPCSCSHDLSYTVIIYAVCYLAWITYVCISSAMASFHGGLGSSDTVGYSHSSWCLSWFGRYSDGGGGGGAFLIHRGFALSWLCEFDDPAKVSSSLPRRCGRSLPPGLNCLDSE